VALGERLQAVHSASERQIQEVQAQVATSHSSLEIPLQEALVLFFFELEMQQKEQREV
jgi:hypothetical protein